MTTIEKLKDELKDIEAKLAKLDPARRIADIQAVLDIAVKRGNQDEVDEAVNALQAAQAGTDSAGRLWATLQAQKRVTEREINEAVAAQEAAERARLQADYDEAHARLKETADEYAMHAQALLSLYPKLYGRTRVAHGTGHPLGMRDTAGSPRLPVFAQNVALPLAGGTGLPPELAGGVTYMHRDLERAEAEETAAFKAHRAVSSTENVGRNEGRAERVGVVPR